MRRYNKTVPDFDAVIVPGGGGECDLSNMRTLCLPCHRAATAALRERLKQRRGASS
jgi:5-methylcytosine-specific restriction enzyme A